MLRPRLAPPKQQSLSFAPAPMPKAGVRHMCRFRTPVRRVTFDDASGKFLVTAHDLVADRESSEEFDHVIVASGHFSTPNVPEFPGFDTFSGRVLHAHDFRDAREFAGKDWAHVGGRADFFP